MRPEPPRRSAHNGNELVAALNAEFGADAPQAFTSREGEPEAAVAIMRGGRSSVSVLPGVDTYILSFRRDAWEWAHGATPDRHRVAQAAVAWVTGTGLEEMAARWPFVRFSELQLAYERGDPLETQWRIVRRDASELYREVVEPAARHPVVSRFFPGLGHNFLFMPHAFSSEVLASVIFETDGRFRLYAPGRQGPVHVGPAPRVVDVLAEHLDGLERRACHT